MINIQYCFKDLLFIALRTKKNKQKITKFADNKYSSPKYNYKYKYLGFKYEYKYKYLDLVLEYNTSTSTRT